jgi:hypothetical protein
MAEFDFSSLTAEETTLPAAGGGKTREIQDNPFVKFVQESYNTKTGRAVTVPNEMVKKTEYLIRQAAEDLGIGVRIAYSLDKEAREKAPKNKNVKVMFQGKEKRKYAPRKNKAEVTPEQAVNAADAALKEQKQ